MRGGQTTVAAVIFAIAGVLFWQSISSNPSCSSRAETATTNIPSSDKSARKLLHYATEHCAAAGNFAQARYSDCAVTLKSMLVQASAEPTFTAEDALLVADLARVRAAQGKDREAEQLLKKALSSAERDLWPEHPDCIRIRGRLISQELKLQENEAAKRLLTQQIRILQTLGTGPDQVWQCQRHLVEVLCSSNDVDSEKALNILVLSGKPTDKGAEELFTVVKAADSLREARNWKLAERLYRRAYELRQFDYRPEMTTYYLGSCCWCQGNLNDAQRYISEAGELRRKRYGAIDPIALSFAESLGRVLSDAGNHSKAQRVLTELVDRCRLTKDKKQLASAHTYLGSAALRAGNLERAEKECSTASDLYRVLGANCAPERTVTLSILAESLDRQKEFARAISTLNEIAAINPSYAASAEFSARMKTERERCSSASRNEDARTK